MKAADRQALFERLRGLNPEPVSELHFANHFQLLVAVILSAQATDKNVNQATAEFFPTITTPQAMLALGEDGLKQHIRRIGLYQTKARNVIATSQQLIERHGSQVPHDRAALEALPGVGRKTANVVLGIAFNEPTIAVDTHVFRVANRTGLATGKTPLEVEKKLLRNVPKEFLPHAHHWLILHGRYVCKARKPDCAHCLIRDLCAWKDKS